MRGDADFAGKTIIVADESAKRLSEVLSHLGWLGEDELVERSKESKEQVLNEVERMVGEGNLMKCTLNGKFWIKAHPHSLADWFNASKDDKGVNMYG
jgi:hypothetical protein